MRLSPNPMSDRLVPSSFRHRWVVSRQRSFTRHSAPHHVSAGGGCNKTRVRAYVTHSLVRPSFAAVAKHYGAAVTVCPPRRGQRVTVAELAAAEPLLAPPTAPYPAVVAVTRIVSAQALVAFRGNHYSVPPGMAGRELIVSARLGSGLVEVATPGPGVGSGGGRGGARPAPAPPTAPARWSATGHVAALEAAVLAGFTDRAACRGKTRRPPSPAARAEAARLRGEPDAVTERGRRGWAGARLRRLRRRRPPDHRPGTGTAGTASTVEETS